MADYNHMMDFVFTFDSDCENPYDDVDTMMAALRSRVDYLFAAAPEDIAADMPFEYETCDI